MNGTEVDVIRKEVLTIPEQAKLIVVKDQESMVRANNLFLVIKGLRKKIQETFGPIISKAHEAHKEALAQQKKVEEPLITGEKWLNGQMASYYAEQERIRKAKEERMRQEAIAAEMKRRQEEEERKLNKAQALEEIGAKEEAEQLVSEAIQAREEPMIVEVAPPPIPKVEVSGVSARITWDFEIIDPLKVPREYLLVDEVKIGKIVRALKEQTNIPGVRVFKQTAMASTGRR